MKDYRKRYLLMLLLSLLLHIAGYGWFLYKTPIDLTIPEQKQTVTVTLKPAPQPQAEQQPPEQAATKVEPKEKAEEKPKPQETVEESHAPRDNADEFASDNQDDKLATEILAGGALDDKVSETTELTKQVIAEESSTTEDDASSDDQSAQEQTEVGDFFDKAQKEKRSFVDAHGDDKGQMDSSEHITGSALDDFMADSTEFSRTEASSATDSQAANDNFKPPPALQDLLIESPVKPFEMEIPSEFLNNVGNMQLLSDASLRDAEVQQPYSEKRSKELELANKYLERMNKQVRQFWVNPYKGGKMFRGVIKVELNVNGYLEDVRIHRASGHHLLDISVMDAIRAVPRFEVPDNEIITNRYYRNMSFHYSSIETKTELMPFETKALDKEES